MGALEGSHGRDASGDLGPEEVDEGVKLVEGVKLQRRVRLVEHRNKATRRTYHRHLRLLPPLNARCFYDRRPKRKDWEGERER